MKVCEGFAHGNISALTDYWAVVLATLSTSSRHLDVNGRGSGYKLIVNNSTATKTYSFAVGEQHLHIANAPESSSKDWVVVQAYRSGSVQWGVGVSSTGVLSIRRGDALTGTVLVSTAAATVPPTGGLWSDYWFDAVADTVAGRIRVWRNGLLIADTGVTNTANTGVAGWDQLGWWSVPVTGTNVWIADIVTYTDAEYTALFGSARPELYIPGVVPTSDDTNTFVSGTYTSVDEIPWSTADTVNANAVGQELIMGNSGLAWTPPAVYGIANTWYQERDGAVASMASRLKSGAANVTGSAVTPSAGAVYSERQDFYAQNPDGTVNWTWAAVTAAKAGVITT